MIVKEDFGKMVELSNGWITAVPLREAVGRLNLVDIQTQYDTERYNGRRTILGDDGKMEYWNDGILGRNDSDPSFSTTIPLLE